MPGVIAFIKPVVVLTVAMAVLLLLQVPPAGVLLQVIDVPVQVPAIPVIDVGTVFTVTVAVTKLDSRE